jgi:hypothetical protein
MVCEIEKNWKNKKEVEHSMSWFRSRDLGKVSYVILNSW